MHKKANIKKKMLKAQIRIQDNVKNDLIKFLHDEYDNGFKIKKEKNSKKNC